MIYLTNDDWNKFVLPKITDNNYFNTELKIIKKIYSLMSFINSKIKLYGKSMFISKDIDSKIANSL